jgi:hypothetical protein
MPAPAQAAPPMESASCCFDQKGGLFQSVSTEKGLLPLKMLEIRKVFLRCFPKVPSFPRNIRRFSDLPARSHKII